MWRFKAICQESAKSQNNYSHPIKYVTLQWYSALLYFINYTRNSIVTYDVQ